MPASGTTVAGTFDWLSGTLTSPTLDISPGATMNVGESNAVLPTFTNDGQVNVLDGGQLIFTSGGTHTKDFTANNTGALEFTNGVVTTVSDSQMLDGMSVVGLNGFDCEMASGATVVGIKKLIDEGIIKKDDTVVGILTGRQKDAMLPVDYHNNPENKFAKPPKN